MTSAPIDKQDPTALLAAAARHAEAGEFDKAAAYCDAALKINPENSEGLYLSSIINIKLNNVEIAIDTLKKIYYY
jgi:tetratricopeptide (TPR) repeat protein